MLMAACSTLVATACAWAPAKHSNDAAVAGQVEGLIAREVETAKELLAAKKRERALLALRKKKLREGQLEQIDAYLLNVEQARATCMHGFCSC